MNLDLLREENGEIEIQNINNIEFNFPSFLINKTNVLIII